MNFSEIWCWATVQHVMDFLSLPQQFIHPPRQCIIREKAEVETNNCNINTGCNTKWTAMQQCGDQNDDKFSERERALAHQMTSTSVRHPYHSPTQACLRWTAHMFSQQHDILSWGATCSYKSSLFVSNEDSLAPCCDVCLKGRFCHLVLVSFCRPGDEGMKI